MNMHTQYNMNSMQHVIIKNESVNMLLQYIFKNSNYHALIKLASSKEYGEIFEELVVSYLKMPVNFTSFGQNVCLSTLSLKILLN